MIEELLAYSLVEERSRQLPADRYRQEWRLLSRLGRAVRRQPELASTYEKPASTYIPSV